MVVKLISETSSCIRSIGKKVDNILPYSLFSIPAGNRTRGRARTSDVFELIIQMKIVLI